MTAEDVLAAVPGARSGGGDANARAGSAAVARIAGGTDQSSASGGAAAAVDRMCCGIRIIAPAGVHPAAIDACMQYVRAEIGRNLYAQQQLQQRRTSLVIIPANTRMTDEPEFTQLRGHMTPAPDARRWEDVRGSGGQQIPDGSFALAVPEENLIAIQSIFRGYGPGYSVGTHEFAHTLENAGMTPQQHDHVKQLYAARAARMAQQYGNWQGIFTDHYASTNEMEYFAQCTCCFFGRNVGEGANGRNWLAAHDPAMYAFCVEMYETAHDAQGHDVASPSTISSTSA